jgi:hypothetical protein
MRIRLEVRARVYREAELREQQRERQQVDEQAGTADRS